MPMVLVKATLAQGDGVLGFEWAIIQRSYVVVSQLLPITEWSSLL
jgi:hypothetical protein